MEAVKSLILVCLVLNAFEVYAQPIDGKFIQKHQNPLMHIEYHFIDSARFERQTGLSVNHNPVWATGYFLVYNDTLVLCFDQYPTELKGRFEIKEKSKLQNENSLSIYLKVCDPQGKPIPGATVVIIRT